MNNTPVISIYIIDHEASKSQTQVICDVDQLDNPHISSIKLLAGKIVHLSSVRDSLKHFKQQRIKNQPDQIA